MTKSNYPEDMPMTPIDTLVLQAMHKAPDRQMDATDVLCFLFGPHGASQSARNSYIVVSTDALHRLAARGLIAPVHGNGSLHRVTNQPAH